MLPRMFLSLIGLSLVPSFCEAVQDLQSGITPELPSELDYFAEQPIVLSVSRLGRSASQSPAAVTVIDRSMLEASGFRQLADVFRLVPGFQVAWVRGNLPVVTYQGLTSLYARRMQVLVDGRSVYNPAYGQVHWRALPVALDDIDRIEVVRGPNAANDGANAFQATIHIYTRHAAQDHGTEAAVSVGENSVLDGVLRHSGSHEDLSWRITYLDRQDDWLDSRYYSPTDGAHERFINLRLDWQASARDVATLESGYSLGNWQNSTVGYTFSPGQTTDFDSWYVQGRWRRVIDADNEWSAQLHHTWTRGIEEFTLPAPLTAPDNLNFWFQRDALEFDAVHRLSPVLRATWGAEVRYDAAWSANLTGVNQVLDGWMYRLSAAGEWSLSPDWLLHVGAMGERNYYGGAMLSPRLALNWQPAPGHGFRLAGSRAFRTPTFLEQNADFKLMLGALNYNQLLLSPYKLKPERITTREFGYVFQSPHSDWGLDVRLFHNQVDDIIDFATPYPVPGEIVGDGANHTYANLVRASQRGGEYQLRWKYDANGWAMLWQSWVSTHSDSLEYADSAPRHSLGLLTGRELGQGWNASLGYYRVGEMTWVGSGMPTPAHDRLDVRLARRWKAADMRWEVACDLQSVLGKYSEYGPTRYFDPRAFVTLKARF
ncbi:MAG: TonB-dependent receptor [Pseudomonadota bacterium]|nr:TonB-dependent receptor [Pseudomonadota bacterium]